MHYLRAYRCLLGSPHWQKNGLASMVCQMVPVLGHVVFTGFAFELVEVFSEQDDRRVPVFDIDRIGLYVVRGIWPFVAQIVALLPVLFVLGLTAFLLAALGRDGPSASVATRVLLIGLGPVGFLVLVWVGVLLAPVTLHVGFRQELGTGLFPFVKDFLSRVGRETFLAQVFVSATGLALVLLGSALCCLPAFLALAVAHFAQYHLLAQLYELYRQRGGVPVPVEPLAA